MRFRHLQSVVLLAVLTLICPSPAFGQNTTEYLRVCYYTNWAQYRPAPGTFTPSNIDPDLCTHLIYAYAKLNNNYELARTETDDYFRYLEFNALKNNVAGLKTFLSVGGWDQGSEKFSVMASNSALRNKFILRTMIYLKTWGFDGLDVKWEYPASRGGLSTDKNNFVMLLLSMKAIFDAQTPPLLLSVAVPAGITFIEPGYDIPQINSFVEFISLMSYDFHGDWDAGVGFNSPLFPRADEADEEAQLNVEWAANYWSSNGASKEKLIIGLPTYGRSFTLANRNEYSVGSLTSGPGEAGSSTRDPGKLAYYEICEKIDSGEGYPLWHNEHKVPYHVNGNQWVGYDNVYSMIAKAEWIIAQNFGGAMFWSLDQDDFGQVCNSSLRNYPLIAAVADVFDGRAPPTVATPPPVTPSTESPIQPPDTSFCDKRANGYYPDPSNCALYYQCANKATFRNGCPSNLYWNVDKELCDWPENVDCNNGTRPEPEDDYCEGKLDGYYPDSDNCSMYYHCWTECTFHETCPTGQEWDTSTEACATAGSFTCIQTTSSTSTTAEPTTVTTPAGGFCSGKFDGYYRNPDDCGSYIRCLGGTKILMECDGAELYDAEALTCKPANQVDCSLTGDTTGFCQTNSGIHPYPDNCKKFFNCANGLPYIFTCPNPYLFSDVNLYCDWEYNVDCGDRPIRV